MKFGVQRDLQNITFLKSFFIIIECRMTKTEAARNLYLVLIMLSINYHTYMELDVYNFVPSCIVNIFTSWFEQ
jgi:hypothetical protein